MKQSTIVCCGTGPSITQQQVNIARTKGRLFVCNNAFKLAPDAELLYAVNIEWWDHYYLEVKFLPCEKWTTNKQAAEAYDLNWIAERGADGLSTDPNVIHHGHGSGFSLVSMAYRAGAKRIALLGYNLRFAPDYDGRSKRIGSSLRHSSLLLPNGEYPAVMRHWPSVKVINGEHVELVRLYQTVRDQGLVELVNCTPDSALEPILGYTPIESL